VREGVVFCFCVVVASARALFSCPRFVPPALHTVAPEQRAPASTRPRLPRVARGGLRFDLFNLLIIIITLLAAPSAAAHGLKRVFKVAELGEVAKVEAAGHAAAWESARSFLVVRVDPLRV